MQIARLALMLMALSGSAHAQERVTFPSADGKTTLVGYVFVPRSPTTPMPAVVMMHGRAGAYSNAAKGRYDASTISRRHRMWGALWAANGYVAVLVDGFAPRGYPAGFPRFSYENRPDVVNEVTVRPLDAYGALTWLRTRKDIAADRIALQGWSNGGSATLAAMAAGAGLAPPASLKGFQRRAGVLCGLPLARSLRRRLPALRAGAGVSRHCRRGNVVPALPVAGGAQPQGRQRHRDHAVFRSHPRLRRSRPRAAEPAGQPKRERRRDRTRAAFLCGARRSTVTLKFISPRRDPRSRQPQSDWPG